MIQINVASPLTPLQLETIRFVNENRAKSFSERNPSLGRMISCFQCGFRHRNTVKHEPLKYAVGRYELNPDGTPMADEDKKILIAPETRNGVMGAARYAKQRWLPHRHPRTLEVKQLTEELFESDLEFAESFPMYQPDITRSVREAIKIVNTRLRSRAKQKRDQAKLSRRINLGLANPGSRP